MLAISTTNTTGTTMNAVVDKITTSGALTDPALRWNYADSEYQDPSTITGDEHLIPLTEDADISGLYSVEIAGIDVLTENIRITILDSNGDAIGASTSIPLATVNPEVLINFEVSESR